MNKLILTLAISSLFYFQSCKEIDDKPNPDPTFGTAEIEFEHVWGVNQAPFELNATLVHPMTKDTMKFTTLKYYVSNIQLKRSDAQFIFEKKRYILYINYFQ